MDEDGGYESCTILLNETYAVNCDSYVYSKDDYDGLTITEKVRTTPNRTTPNRMLLAHSQVVWHTLGISRGKWHSCLLSISPHINRKFLLTTHFTRLRVNVNFCIPLVYQYVKEVTAGKR